MKKYRFILNLVSALLIALPPRSARADDVIIEDDQDPDAIITYVSLAWDPNPENNIAGYNVYYGRVSGGYTRLETVADTSADIGVRGTRTVYFAVTAFNTYGLESLFSEEVQWP